MWAQKNETETENRGGLSVKIGYATDIIWTQLGPVAGNDRVSSRKIPDARLHTTETETETENPKIGICSSHPRAKQTRKGRGGLASGDRTGEVLLCF